MRFYKVVLDKDVDGAENEPRVRWATTQAEATKARMEMMDLHDVKRASISIDETDVPTDKTGLAQFLRDNVKE